MIYAGPGERVEIMDCPNYGPLWSERYPIALVAHTTETKSRPGYSEGAWAPHITIDPAAQVVYQHQLLDRRCGALRGTKKVHDDTGVWTVMNEKAVQVEIIGYSDRNTVLKHGNGRRWVGDFGEDDYAFIAAVFDYLRRRIGIGDGLHARPSGESWRSGISSPYRLGAAAWEQFDGLTAHGGIFGQIHWDTGVLDLNRIWRGDDLMTPEDRKALDWLKKQLNQGSVSDWAQPAWDKAVAKRMIRDGTRPGEPVTVERMATFLDRPGLLGEGRLWTKAQILTLAATAAAGGASAGSVIEEIIRRLGG